MAGFRIQIAICPFFAGTCWERSEFGKSNIKTVIILVRTPSVRRPKSPSRQILLHGQRIYRNPLLHPSWWIWWEGLLSFFLYLSVLDSPSRVLLSRNPNFICTFWSHSNCSGYGILCVFFSPRAVNTVSFRDAIPFLHLGSPRYVLSPPPLSPQITAKRLRIWQIPSSFPSASSFPPPRKNESVTRLLLLLLLLLRPLPEVLPLLTQLLHGIHSCFLESTVPW